MDIFLYASRVSKISGRTNPLNLIVQFQHSAAEYFVKLHYTV